ncbi:transient receptor potential cation channel protein painless-like isoform X2 [Sitodiplosis mosellana]|uniref:transient receptor potential cation channel protein painless-like isoform X2 n=1 Tax=Sitodiplosis mosellana TaxID=263140 RepID=UPI002444F72D|nr:transient receptor potential cation channel protein painless-like isoform X2 [Sitodiplosis mosellana]
MTKQELDVPYELKSFRTQLFNVDKNDDNLKKTLNALLDKYRGDHFDTFAEEYLIAGFEVGLLNNDLKSKLDQLLIDGDLPSIRDQDVTHWDRDRLMFCLMFDNEDVFAKGLKLVAEKSPDEIPNLNIESMDNKSGDNSSEPLNTWRNISLINIAVLKDLHVAIKKLGSINADFNSTAIHSVYEYGRWECLRKLLEKRKKMSWRPVKLSNFITFLMRAQTYDKDCREYVDKQIDFGKCVDLLFNYAEYEINEQNIDQYSPLQLAVMYNKPKAILHLLKRGAYIGVQDAVGRPAIWNINPKILEKHFDHCITGENLVIFNFENLIAPSSDYPNDLSAIEFISNSNDFRHLLEHPLIASFSSLKWTRMALVFYTDFLLYFLLSLATGFISMYYMQNPKKYLIHMGFITGVFITYIAFRRFVQVIFRTLNRRSWENYLNFLLTISNVMLLVLFVIGVQFNFQSSTLAALCIVLITYEFFLLAGTFWHFSIYFEMFIAVATSSIQSLQFSTRARITRFK